jgi:hypothetical protein
VNEQAGAWQFTSPLLQVVLSDGNLFRAGNSHWGDERKTDLLLWYTQLVDASETIRLPGGWQLQDKPSIEPVDETYAAYSGSARQDGRKLVIAGRAEVRRRQIPPDGYPGFKKAMDAARTWADQEFRFTKGDK